MEKEAVLDLIKQYRSEGMTFQEIADKLKSDGILTFTGKADWHKATIKNILDRLGQLPVIQDDKVKQDIQKIDKPTKTITKKALSLQDRQALDKKSTVRHVYPTTDIKRLQTQIDEIKQFAETITQNFDAEITGIKAELLTVRQALSRLDSELSSTKQIDTDRQSPVKHNAIRQIDSQKQENVGKWNFQFSGGYYRAFRKVDGKMIACYIGREFNRETAIEKIRKFEVEKCLEPSV